MKKLTLLLLISIPLLGISQIKQEIRKEIDLRESNAANVVVVDKGVVAYGYTKQKGAPDILEIVSYSSDLEKLSTKEVDYPDKSVFFSVVVSGKKKQHVQFICLTKKEVHTISYAVEDYGITQKATALNQAFSPMSVREMGGKLFFLGTVKKIPTVMIYDPSSGKQTYVTVPGTSKKRVVKSYQPDNLGETMVFFYRDGKSIKKSSTYIFMLDAEGKMRNQPISLDKDPKYSIIDGVITWVNENDFILAGTYGISNSPAAIGMYFSKWSGASQTTITYHSFMELENFFKYLPKKAQEKIEKRKAKNARKGKEEYEMSLVAVHPVIDLKGSYMFVGELYYATYRTETRTTFVNGKATTTRERVFDGYEYTHAVALELDEDGNKLYDHCFPIDLTYKPMAKVYNLRVVTKKDVTKLLYCTGDRLTGVFIQGEDMSEKDYGSVASEREGDKVKWGTRTLCNYWYDNYYLVHGVQRIKNKEEEGDKKRTIFFLSKISYED